MARKTVGFNKAGIGNLPDNKSATYHIQTAGGKTNYVGVAKKERVQDRVAEHLAGSKDPVPGAKVQIRQYSSIDAAKAHEKHAIARTKPPHTVQGK